MAVEPPGVGIREATDGGGCMPTILMAVTGRVRSQVARGGAQDMRGAQSKGSGVGSAMLVYSSLMEGFCSRAASSSPAECVTAAAVDPATRLLYTGHSDGSITVCTYTEPAIQPASFACTNAAVTAMCVDDAGKLWLGDSKGRVLFISLYPFAIQTLRPFEEVSDSASSLSSPARGALGPAGRPHGLRSVRFPSFTQGQLHDSVLPTNTSITAVFAAQDLVLAADDHSNLCLITAADRRVRAVVRNPHRGFITSMAAVPWPPQDSGSAAPQAAFDSELSATPDERGPPRQRVATSPLDSSCEPAGAPCSGAGLAWRLLTGTSQGSFLLWDVSCDHLKLLWAKVPSFAAGTGPAAARNSAIRAVFVYPGLSMLVACQSDGRLLVAHLPAESDQGAALPAGGGPHAAACRAWKAPDAQLRAVRGIGLCFGRGSLPVGDNDTGGKVPALALPCAAIRAHKGRLSAADACGLQVATGGEAGGIKVWDVLELRRSAVEQGVQLPPLPPHVADSSTVRAPLSAGGLRSAAAGCGDSVSPVGALRTFVQQPAPTAHAAPALNTASGNSDDAQPQSDLERGESPCSPKPAGVAAAVAADGGCGEAAAGGCTGTSDMFAVAAASEAAASPFALMAATLALGGNGDGKCCAPVVSAACPSARSPRPPAQPPHQERPPDAATALLRPAAAPPTRPHGAATPSPPPIPDAPAARGPCDAVFWPQLMLSSARGSGGGYLAADASAAAMAGSPLVSLANDTPFRQATRAAAVAAGCPASPAASGRLGRLREARFGATTAVSCGGAGGVERYSPHGCLTRLRRRTQVEALTSPQLGGAADDLAAGDGFCWSAGLAGLQQQAAMRSARRNASCGGAAFATGPHLAGVFSPSSSQGHLAAAASSPFAHSATMLPAHANSFMPHMQSAPFNAVTPIRAIAAARALAAASCGGAAMGPGSCIRPLGSLPGSPCLGHRASLHSPHVRAAVDAAHEQLSSGHCAAPIGARRSLGFGQACLSRGSVGGADVYGMYGMASQTSYEQLLMSLMSGPGGALARDPAFTFIRKGDLELMQEIGSGAEGRVWCAKWRHTDVAVKEIFPSAPTFAKLTNVLRSQLGRSGTAGGAAAATTGHSSSLRQAPAPSASLHGLAATPPRLSVTARAGSTSAAATPTKPSAAAAAAAAAATAATCGGAAAAAVAAGETRFLQTTESTVPSATLHTTHSTLGSSAAGAGSDGSWDADVTAVIKEVRALAHLSQHPNIVRFVGLCLEPPLIVTEYYPRGNLHELLQKAAAGDCSSCMVLDWHNRLCMMHDVAAGMSYLHSQHYLHGDLRSPNVFVEQDSRVKIGDFGFAKLLGDGSRGCASANKDLNPRWMAPEALQFGRLTFATDVFSFGVLLWEVLTWQMPYEEYEPAKVVLLLALDPEFRPVVPPRDQLPCLPPHADVDGYMALMRSCWHCDPAARPTFDAVADQLEALKAASAAACADLRRSEANGPTGHASPLPRMGRNVSCAGDSAPSPGGLLLAEASPRTPVGASSRDVGNGAGSGRFGTPPCSGDLQSSHRRGGSSGRLSQSTQGYIMSERALSGGGASFCARVSSRGPSLVRPAIPSAGSMLGIGGSNILECLPEAESVRSGDVGTGATPFASCVTPAAGSRSGSRRVAVGTRFTDDASANGRGSRGFTCTALASNRTLSVDGAEEPSVPRPPPPPSQEGGASSEGTPSPHAVVHVQRTARRGSQVQHLVTGSRHPSGTVPYTPADLAASPIAVFGGAGRVVHELFTEASCDGKNEALAATQGTVSAKDGDIPEANWEPNNAVALPGQAGCAMASPFADMALVLGL